jgi:hypothetical protein
MQGPDSNNRIIKFLGRLSRKNRKLIAGMVFIISDIAVLCCGSLLAYYLKFNTGFFDSISKGYDPGIPDSYLGYSASFVIFTIITFYIMRMYD